MCLIVDGKLTKETRERFKQADGKLTMYKVLSEWKNDIWDFTHYVYDSPYYPGKNSWTPGKFIKSDRKRRRLSLGEWAFDKVDYGIHVFVTCLAARESQIYWLKHNNVIVPVTVYETDFIRAGQGGEAVFTKVFLPSKFEVIRHSELEINHILAPF